jgi:hypothetical protein
MKITNVSNAPLTSVAFGSQFPFNRSIPVGQTITVPDSNPEVLTKVAQLARSNKASIDEYAPGAVTGFVDLPRCYQVRVKDAAKTAGFTLTFSTTGTVITVGVTASASAAAAAAVAAINANSELTEAGIFALDFFPNAIGGAATVDHLVVIESRAAVTITSSDGTNAAAASVTGATVAAKTLFRAMNSRTAAGNIAAGTPFIIPTGLRTITSFTLQVVRDNVLITLKSKVAALGGSIVIFHVATGGEPSEVIDDNLKEGDVVTVLAEGTLELS